MTALTLYARHEPTTDPVCLHYCPPAQLPALRDVALYRDPQATKQIARFSAFQTRPARHSRYVRINCYRWNLVWIED
jgi:hypothetical protein